MFSRFVFGGIIALFATTTLVAKEATIKVLVATGVEEAQVRADGGYKVSNPANGKTVTRSLLSKNYQIVPLATGLKWGEEFPGIYQLTIAPRKAKQPIVYNGVEYPGILHIYQVERTLNVVNEVSVEDYLKVQLTNRLTQKPSQEVLSALAIAGRTTAYFERGKGMQAHWQVKAEEVGYHPRAIPVAIDRVVNDTEKMVMVSNQAPGKAFPAVWTENSAGRTAPYPLFFRKGVAVPLPGVASPLALRAKEASSWQYALSKGELAEGAHLSGVTSINLFTDPYSEKVYAVRLFDGERWRDFDYFTFQNLVGVDHLKSSDFSVEVEEDQVVFRGYGVGHGVGICLYSAEEMVRRGQNARNILGAFFPYTDIEVVEGEEGTIRPRNGPQPAMIRHVVSESLSD